MAERPRPDVQSNARPSARSSGGATAFDTAVAHHDADGEEPLVETEMKTSPAKQAPDPYLFDEPTARGPAHRLDGYPPPASASGSPPVRVPVVAVGGAPASVPRMREPQKTLMGGLDVATARAILKEHAGGSSPDFDLGDMGEEKPTVVTSESALLAGEMPGRAMPGSVVLTPSANPSEVDVILAGEIPSAPAFTSAGARPARPSYVEIETARQVSPAAFVSHGDSLRRTPQPDAAFAQTLLSTDAAAHAPEVMHPAPSPRSSSASWSSVGMAPAPRPRRWSRVGMAIGLAAACAVAIPVGIFVLRGGFAEGTPRHVEPAQAASDLVSRDATVRGRAARPVRGTVAPAATPAAHKPSHPKRK